jgi:hypothetical protein
VTGNVSVRPALWRVFVRRVIGAALAAPGQRRYFSRDTDRMSADQFPCAGDPDQAADMSKHVLRICKPIPTGVPGRYDPALS